MMASIMILFQSLRRIGISETSENHATEVLQNGQVDCRSESLSPQTHPRTALTTAGKQTT